MEFLFLLCLSTLTWACNGEGNSTSKVPSVSSQLATSLLVKTLLPSSSYVPKESKSITKTLSQGLIKSTQDARLHVQHSNSTINTPILQIPSTTKLYASNAESTKLYTTQVSSSKEIFKTTTKLRKQPKTSIRTHAHIITVTSLPHRTGLSSVAGDKRLPASGLATESVSSRVLKTTTTASSSVYSSSFNLRAVTQSTRRDSSTNMIFSSSDRSSAQTSSPGVIEKQTSNTKAVQSTRTRSTSSIDIHEHIITRTSIVIKANISSSVEQQIRGQSGNQSTTHQTPKLSNVPTLTSSKAISTSHASKTSSSSSHKTSTVKVEEKSSSQLFVGAFITSTKSHPKPSSTILKGHGTSSAIPVVIDQDISVGDKDNAYSRKDTVSLYVQAGNTESSMLLPSSVAASQNTKIITIRKSKDRGLPPWAVITVAVGAFLFVCLIAIAAFKIVQWNKDHGDYKLWSTDLELTPITSRVYEDLGFASEDYEKPLETSRDDIHIYSEGRCISVVKARERMGSITVEVIYPLKSEKKESNNNLKGLLMLNYKEDKSENGSDSTCTPPGTETSVFNIELCDSPIKKDNVDIPSAEPPTSSPSLSDSPSDSDTPTEPKYSSIDELGLVAFNPNDLFCQGFDAYKPLPPTPCESPTKPIPRRARACSLDDDDRPSYPPIMCAKSNPDFLSTVTKLRSGLKFCQGGSTQAGYPAFGGTFPRKWRAPPLSHKDFAVGERRLRHEIGDVGKFMLGNSQEQLYDINFSSNRRARTPPRHRLQKRCPEAKLWPGNRRAKKTRGASETSFDSQPSFDSSDGIKILESRDVGKSSTLPRKRSNPPSLNSVPRPLPAEDDDNVVNSKNRGCKDFVEIEIGCGRPRLISREGSTESASFDSPITQRGRSASTPVETSEFVRRMRRISNDSPNAHSRLSPANKLGNTSEWRNGYKRKFSVPVDLRTREPHQSSRPLKNEGEKTSDMSTYTSNTSLTSNDATRKISESPLPLPRLVETNEMATVEKGSEAHNDEHDELDRSDALTPYAEVRMSAVLNSTERLDRLIPPRPHNLVLPYLTVDLKDAEFSASDGESSPQTDGYLKIVPNLTPTPSMKSNSEHIYWYPKISNLGNYRPGISDPSEVVSDNESPCTPSEVDSTSWYAEIDARDGHRRSHTYETLKRNRENERLSIVSIPEPGYEAVRKRASVLVAPSRDSIDSAVFSSSDDILKIHSDNEDTEKEHTVAQKIRKSASLSNLISSDNLFLCKEGKLSSDSFKVLECQGIDAQRKRRETISEIGEAI